MLWVMELLLAGESIIRLYHKNMNLRLEKPGMDLLAGRLDRENWARIAMDLSRVVSTETGKPYKIGLIDNGILLSN